MNIIDIDDYYTPLYNYYRKNHKNPISKDEFIVLSDLYDQYLWDLHPDKSPISFDDYCERLEAGSDDFENWIDRGDAYDK